MSRSVKDKIKAARRPEATVPICMRADLVAEHEDLERQIDALRDADTGMLASPVGAQRRQIAKDITEIEAAMREDTMVFRMRAVGNHRWDELLAEHPPRQGDESDAARGFNGATFWAALLQLSVVDPQLDDDDWDALLGVEAQEASEGQEAREAVDGVLTSRQFGSLCEAAWGLNRRDVAIPFSRTASAILHPSANGSPPPSD